MRYAIKKKAAALLSAVMALSCIPFSANVSAADEANVIYSTDFEDGDVSAFTNRGGDDTTELSASTEYAVSGSTSLCASGRTESWNGPAFQLDDKCEPGKEYYVSAKVRGQWYTSVTVSYQYSDSSGTPQYVNLANVSGGDWLEVKDLKVSFSDDVTGVFVYFEGGSDNIYLDDFSVTEAPEIPIEEDIPSLKEVYNGYFKVGAATTTMELSPQSTKNLMLKHFNSITLGNELKPDALLRQAATQELGSETEVAIDIASARSILNFCKKHNIPVRGHVLVWHSQTPDWFFKKGYDNENDWVDEETMLKRMENYIKAVFEALEAEYADVNFYAWDVVNEAWTDQGTPRQGGEQGQNGSENSAWVKVFGDNSFIEHAFRFARKYAPAECKLFYNDYNEYMTGKMDAIIKMAEELKAEDLIDGIGMQSHLDARQGSDAFPSVSMYEAAVKAYTQTGLDVQVTELDVTINQGNDSGFKAQAQYYSDIMDVLVKYSDGISSVVFWGTTDDKSWRSDRFPLLFNGDYTAKECFYSIVDDVPKSPNATSTTTTSTTTTTTTTTTSTIDPPAGVGEGDTNCDNEVDISDVIMLSRYVAEDKEIRISDAGLRNSDLNNDGKYTAADTAIILKKIAKLI